ncbi:MAG: hypothetical protein EZS28_032450, partial [Streblomastix strix]
QTAVKKRVFRRRGRFRAHRAAQVRAVIPTANHQVNRAAMFRVTRAVIIIRVQIRNRAMKNLRVKAAAVMKVLIKGGKVIRTQEAVVNNHQLYFCRIFAVYHQQICIVAAKLIEIEQFDKDEWNIIGLFEQDPLQIRPYVVHSVF